MKGEILYNSIPAGFLKKENGQYQFTYLNEYLEDDKTPAISISFPKRSEPFISNTLFPFFYGLLAEGDNKLIQCRKLKIDEDDHFTRLLKTAGENTIGAITIREVAG